MRTITTLCTSHSEQGLCNAAELLNILEEIGPSVIFEELRPADFDLYHGDGSKQTLEIRAIRSYLIGRKVQQVPVDDWEAPENFGPHIRALDEFVESRSPEYCTTMDDIHRMQAESGFRYLNSQDFISHISKSEQLYKETVSKYGNDLAKSNLATWNDLMCKRDRSMLENIYAFCQETDFKDGVFLVGAAHISAIADGIESRMKKQPNLVTWKRWNRA